MNKMIYVILPMCQYTVTHRVYRIHKDTFTKDYRVCQNQHIVQHMTKLKHDHVLIVVCTCETAIFENSIDTKFYSYVSDTQDSDNLLLGDVHIKHPFKGSSLSEVFSYCENNSNLKEDIYHQLVGGFITRYASLPLN